MKMKDLFPGMQVNAFRLTSPPDVSYNCLAWAAGANDVWWDPSPGYYWPDEAPRNWTVESLIKAYVEETPKAEDSPAKQILNNQFGWTTAATPQEPQQQTNENTMATATLDATPVNSVGCSLPEVGSTWIYRGQDNTAYHGTVIATGSEGVTIRGKSKKWMFFYTAAEWMSFPKTQLYTKKELKQMAKQSRPGNIIVKTGGSRKRWFAIGAAAMYVGKPFLPAAAYHVMQFVNSIL